MGRPRLRKLDYQEFPPPRFQTPLPGASDWRLWQATDVLLELEDLSLPAERGWSGRLAEQVESFQSEPYLGLELEVAAPRMDLKNLLAPIARALPLRLAVARRAARNRLRVTRVERVAPPVEAAHLSCLRTWGPAASRWREDLRQRFLQETIQPLPPGDVSLALSWRCSSLQNWVELWRPTGDSLGPVLGERRPMRPRLDRVSQLSLHLSHDDRLGMAVDVGYWWSLVG